MSLIAFIGLLISLKEISKVTNGLQLYFTNPFLAREQIITLQEGTARHVSQISYKIGSYLCSLMYPLASVGRDRHRHEIKMEADRSDPPAAGGG
ncbi:MAG: hypothetical protein U5N26_11915 [Candidatus Marinimicrobia bacterium]|nr:hypothetical protein [Candidatus Neomarinimicrobiota bacterium]